MVGQDPVKDGIRKQRGAIVNIASQLGIVGRPNARMSSTIISIHVLDLFIHSILIHTSRVLRLQSCCNCTYAFRRNRLFKTQYQSQLYLSRRDRHTHDDFR